MAESSSCSLLLQAEIGWSVEIRLVHQSMRGVTEILSIDVMNSGTMKWGGDTEAMDEVELGKTKFLEVVHAIDGSVQVVIPVTSSNSMFLISLTKGSNRKFITVSEDDIIDLPNEASIETKVTKTIKDAVAVL